MRVLIAPDEFTGTLTAVEAGRAIAAGWARSAPGDEFDVCPMSDGGPGFVDTLHAALGGHLLAATVTGPMREMVPAAVLQVGDTVYVESAQACGLHLIPLEQRDPTITTSFGVGELISVAVTAGARRIVVGLGGSGTNDAGAGLLAALGARCVGAHHGTDQLASGGTALKTVIAVDLTPARELLAGCELIAATDVDSPLLGLTGATNTYAQQKGASAEDVMVLEGALEHFAGIVGRRPDGKDPAVALGAGAAGGLGYALLQLGATRAAGIATVIEAVDLTGRVSGADLVITGEGCFDWQSLRGKVVTGVAAAALVQARPCVVIAGDVVVGRREYSAIGVTTAYSVSEIAGGAAESLARPAASLAAAGQRVARTWSGQR